MKELCVRCGKPTSYYISTLITIRRWYVEGAGQLCEACYSRLYRLPAAFLSDCEPKTDGKKEAKKEMQFTWFNKDGRKRTVNLSSISDIEQYEEDGHYCLRAKNAFFGGNFAAEGFH